MEAKQKKKTDVICQIAPSELTVSPKKNKKRKELTANLEKMVAEKITQEFQYGRDSYNHPFGWRWIWMMG